MPLVVVERIRVQGGLGPCIRGDEKILVFFAVLVIGGRGLWWKNWAVLGVD